jgi:hypothetical protein
MILNRSAVAEHVIGSRWRDGECAKVVHSCLVAKVDLELWRVDRPNCLAAFLSPASRACLMSETVASVSGPGNDGRHPRYLPSI